MEKKLLLIEEEGYVVSRLEALFRDFPGLTVSRTSDAEEARLLLADNPYDIVVTDIYARGASGLELSSRALKTNPKCCVIVISGVDNEDLAKKAVAEGAYDYVIKPPGLDKIASLLKLYLKFNR
ncbi:MAG TPA: response regulator [Elusimicrobiales bacterium]|nr:response regulator [Elusimicrobiales bacterium]